MSKKIYVLAVVLLFVLLSAGFSSMLEAPNIPGVYPTVYTEDGRFDIHAVFPQTDSEYINEDILSLVRREIDHFKELAGSGRFEMWYAAHAYHRYLVSFTIKLTRQGTDEQDFPDKETTLVYDLLGGKRLDSSVLNGSTWYEFATGYFETSVVWDETPQPTPVPERVPTPSPEPTPVAIDPGFTTAGMFANAAEDFNFPLDAMMQPGWRQINVVLDMFQIADTPFVYDNKKYIALTFDDGPDRTVTTRILDYLAEYDAKATFFVEGRRIPQTEDLIRRMFDEGHGIGNHTFSHDMLTAIPAARMNWQILETNRLLEELLGTRINMFRPPYMATNQRINNFVRDLDMSIILWDIDPRDWENLNAQRIANHIIERVQDGSIIILHDLYATTADAVEIVLRTLTERGFVFVTVEELINMHHGLEPGLTFRNGKTAGK